MTYFISRNPLISYFAPANYNITNSQICTVYSIRAILYISIFLLSTNVAAETLNLRFSHITTDDGLVHNHVTCIMQDSSGLMWFGTKNGLCRYDGYEIKTYQHNANDSSSLNHNFIHSIFQDREKRIWIGTENGICRYLPDRDAFVQYPEPAVPVSSFAQNSRSTLYCSAGILYSYREEPDEFLPVEIAASGRESKYITGARVLSVDRNDRLWTGGNTGLTGYDADFSKSDVVNILPPGRSHRAEDNVNALFVDSKGVIWIGKNGNGILSYNPQTVEVRFYTGVPGVPSGLIRSIMGGPNGRIWFGTEKGISVLLNSGEFCNVQQNLANRFALNDNAIYSILCDRSGNMWLGSYFGGVNVLYYDFEQFTYYDAGVKENELQGKAVRQIIGNSDNTLRIATEDEGLYKLDKSNGNFDRIRHPLIRSDNIHSLLIDDRRNLWIGTFWGGLTRCNLKTNHYTLFNTQNSALPDNCIFCLFQDKNHTVWIGTSSGLCFLNKQTGRIERVENELLKNTFVYHISQDAGGNLWMGSRARGLIFFNSEQNVARNWTAQKGPHSLSDNFVTTTLVDSKNRIWVGTNNGGLYEYRTATGDFRSFRNEALINEPCICALIEDNDGALWITTNQGLFCYHPEKAEIKKYTTENGLPTNNFNYVSAYRDDNGTIFLGTVHGMISFNPQNIHQEVNFPNIILSRLIIGNETMRSNTSESSPANVLDNTSCVELKHTQAQFISIEYAGIAPGHSREINYAVKMEGLNDNWQDVGSQRRIIFSRLPAGKYIFKVKATLAKNTSIRQFELIVHPPFYASVYALTLYLLTALALTGFILKFYYRRLKEKNEIRVNILEKQKLEEMNRLKHDFFTKISHELKMPLTLIMAPVCRMLAEPDLNEKTRQKLDLILKNSNSLMNLVKELIDFNKMESNQLHIKLQKGNPMDFIREICHRFQALACEDNVDFTVRIENLEEEVWFSLSIVEKVINNLLSNAFKYTPQGGEVKLFAAITDGENSRLLLKIIVSDTGIGISKEDREKIFRAYYQANDAILSKRPGWGIGLTIIKDLIQQHKGDIYFESELGKGSTFVVRLDVSPDAFPVENRLDLRADRLYLKEKYNYSSIIPEEQLQQIRKNTPAGDVSKNKILIVEDNVDLLQFLAGMFEEKYDVDIVKNGREAFEKMEKALPDLIISDLMMPEMDGIELCRSIKSNLLTSHIPVVLLTAKSGEENVLKGYELGADAYIEKPFNPEALLLLAKNLLNTRDNNRRRFKESVTANIGIIAHNKYDEKLLNDIRKCVDDNISNGDFCVNDIVRTVGVSRTMLHVKLKSMLDMSVGDYIHNIRIDRAKQLLLQGDCIADTAYATGFADPNYFSKCFKKQTGQSPSEWLMNTKNPTKK
jgi:ligand-binding sensor domain-containing protein/signal transduction histidine kinase/DNA-binding response OmpR family regulator